jgi:DHA2 family multidrug resistance protein
MQGAQLAITAVALSLGTFMQVLDTTIANVAIPTIAGNLGASSDQGTWVITSFAVANGISVPLTGWLMQRYGVVRMFLFAVLGFTIASFLCGIAWNLPSLIAFRVLQGAVAGPMMPGSQTLLLMMFPPARRTLALALWSMTTLVAPICGPLLGGWISDNATWPWIFYINVPVGIAVAAICWTNLRTRETPTRILPIDRVGIILLAIWVGALQIMLDKGKDEDWFESPLIVVLLLVTLVVFAAWMIWEWTEKHPIIDFSLFRNRNFTLGLIPMSLGYAVFFSNIVLLSLWIQTQLGYTATWAGLVAAPGGIIAVIISPFVGRIMGRVDPRWLVSWSFVAFGLSYFMRSQLTTDAAVIDFVIPQLIMGFAMGTFFVAILTILLDGIPPMRVPSASALAIFFRTIAASFATSISATLWDRREALHQSHLASESSIFDPTLTIPLTQLKAAGLSDVAAASVLNRQLVGQSYLLASTEFFRLSAIICVLLIGVIWITRRPGSGQGAAAAAE